MIAPSIQAVENIDMEVTRQLDLHGYGSMTTRSINSIQYTFRYENDAGKVVSKSVSGKTEEECRQKKYKFLYNLVVQKRSKDIMNYQMELYNQMIKNVGLSNSLISQTNIVNEPIKETIDFKAPETTRIPLVSTAINEYIEFIKKEEISQSYKNSINSTLNLVDRYFENEAVTDINRKRFNEFFNDILYKKDGQPRCRTSLNQIKSMFEQFLRYCLNKDYIQDISDISKEFRLPRGTKVSDPEDRFININSLSVVLNGLQNNLRYYVITHIIALTGLRGQELIALEMSDILRKDKLIEVRQAIKLTGKETDNDRAYKIGDTKSKSSRRYTPATQTVIDLIDLWLSYCEKTGLREKARKKGNEQLIFINRDGNIINRQSLGITYTRYLENNINEHITLHMIRHSEATYLTEEGANINDVALSLGHSFVVSEVTEKVYIARNKAYAKRLLKYARKVEKSIKAIHDIDGTISYFQKRYNLRVKKGRVYKGFE